MEIRPNTLCAVLMYSEKTAYLYCTDGYSYSITATVGRVAVARSRIRPKTSVKLPLVVSLVRMLRVLEDPSYDVEDAIDMSKVPNPHTVLRLLF